MPAHSLERAAPVGQPWAELWEPCQGKWAMGGAHGQWDRNKAGPSCMRNQKRGGQGSPGKWVRGPFLAFASTLHSLKVSHIFSDTPWALAMQAHFERANE